MKISVSDLYINSDYSFDRHVGTALLWHFDIHFVSCAKAARLKMPRSRPNKTAMKTRHTRTQIIICIIR